MRRPPTRRLYFRECADGPPCYRRRTISPRAAAARAGPDITFQLTDSEIIGFDDMLTLKA